MDPLVWAALLLLVGLTLVICEVFIPSGGILGLLSVAALVTAVSLAFYHKGLEIGLLFVFVATVLVPAALALAFRYWPHTPMGRRLLLEVRSPRRSLARHARAAQAGATGWQTGRGQDVDAALRRGAGRRPHDRRHERRHVDRGRTAHPRGSGARQPRGRATGRGRRRTGGQRRSFASDRVAGHRFAGDSLA